MSTINTSIGRGGTEPSHMRMSMSMDLCGTIIPIFPTSIINTGTAESGRCPDHAMSGVRRPNNLPFAHGF